MTEYKSMAGSNKVYFGSDNFRIRKNGSLVRLHLPKTNLRDREKYVAIDFTLDNFIAAINAAGLVQVKEVTRTVTETVLVPQEITKEVTCLEVVAG